MMLKCVNGNDLHRVVWSIVKTGSTVPRSSYDRPTIIVGVSCEMDNRGQDELLFCLLLRVLT